MDHSSKNHYSNGINGTHFTNGDLKTNSQANETGELDFFRLVLLLFQYKWILLSAITIFTILGYILYTNQTPIYKSNGTIIISESKNRYSYAGSDLSNLLFENRFKNFKSF